MHMHTPWHTLNRSGDGHLPERSGHQREGVHDLQHPGAAARKLQRPRRRLRAQRNPAELQKQARTVLTVSFLTIANDMYWPRNDCRIEAEQYLQTVPRTWAIWIGIGDYQTQRFDLVDYSQKESIAYTDVTAPSLT